LYDARAATLAMLLCHRNCRSIYLFIIIIINLLPPFITFSLFHSELKTYLFRKSYPAP